MAFNHLFIAAPGPGAVDAAARIVRVTAPRWIGSTAAHGQATVIPCGHPGQLTAVFTYTQSSCYQNPKQSL
jgi:hypothetical protein